jgi:uncharacterized membrane protein YwaF
MNELGAYIPVLFFLTMTIVFVGSLIWAYADAERRNKSGCLVALLVFLFWPIGLLIWLIFRPDGRERR